MNNEKVPVKIKERAILEKYDGEYSPDKTPVELMEIEDGIVLQVLTDPEKIKSFLQKEREKKSWQ